MTRDLYRHAERLQRLLQQVAQGRGPDGLKDAPRIALDAWATLYRWHEGGERVWRISPAVADEMADVVLPPDLPLATAPVRAEAVAYQLPERGQWLVLARHAPAPAVVVVYGEIRWAYAQPVLTYCTELEDGTLASGGYSLTECPTAGSLPDRLRAGTSLGLQGARRLGEAETTEEEARLALALVHHYLPR